VSISGLPDNEVRSVRARAKKIRCFEAPQKPLRAGRLRLTSLVPIPVPLQAENFKKSPIPAPLLLSPWIRTEASTPNPPVPWHVSRLPRRSRLGALLDRRREGHDGVRAAQPTQCSGSSPAAGVET
jgi:hypothetical protein